MWLVKVPSWKRYRANCVQGTLWRARCIVPAVAVRYSRGAVVHVHDGAAYEVEFASGAGRVLAVVTLTAHDVRPVADAAILHVRALS
jgi:hypothetical protein